MTTEAPKTAAPPKRPKPSEDEAADAKRSAPVQGRPGLLPTGLARAIVLAAVVLGGTAIVATMVPHRYALVPAPRSDNALVYRIDSLTGQVSLCSATQCQPVTEKN